MPRGQRLLHAPPAALQLALQGLHQDIDVLVPNIHDWPKYLLDFVRSEQRGEILTYLNAVLDDPSIGNADLKGLLNRAQTDVFLNSAGARALLEGMRTILRNNNFA